MIKINKQLYRTIEEQAIQDQITEAQVYNRIKVHKYKTRKLMNKTIIEV